MLMLAKGGIYERFEVDNIHIFIVTTSRYYLPLPTTIHPSLSPTERPRTAHRSEGEGWYFVMSHTHVNLVQSTYKFSLRN